MRAATILTITSLVSSAVAGYSLQDNYASSNFFSMFDFSTFADPTNGYVQYVSQSTAQSDGLINTNNGAVYIGVDHTNVASGSGRSSVRLTSKNSYNHGLVILDLAHMPGGICGTWPAFWMVGPNWPNSGEIDIIEGVNSQDSNSMTLHTDAGCTIANNGQYTGTMTTPNCNVAAPGQSTNAGCQINTPSTASYGNIFNANGGGIYATEWTSSEINIWFFPRSSIPSDITSGSPDPVGWGTATASFSGSCDFDEHFMNQQIVFDTTFCGDWAGAVWSSDTTCSPKAATCQTFVQNNPSAFADAYWSVNSLKVYQSSSVAIAAADVASSPTSVPITSTPIVSLIQNSTKSLTSTTAMAATLSEASIGAVAVSTAANNPEAKAVPIQTSSSVNTTGGVFAQISSQTTPLPVLSLYSTSTSTMTVNGDISPATLASTTSTTPAPVSLPVTSIVSESYVTVSALDSYEFPSYGEPQTAGVPIQARKRDVHRHLIRHQRKRHGFAS